MVRRSSHVVLYWRDGPICENTPPFGAFTLTYSSCLKSAGYFRSPNDEMPWVSVSSAKALPGASPLATAAAVNASTLRRLTPSPSLWERVTVISTVFIIVLTLLALRYFYFKIAVNC